MSRISTGSARQKVSRSSPSKVATVGKRADVSRKPVHDGADRYQMIATAAYFRAEHRGFAGGDPVEDWLAAEAEIDQLYH